MTKDVIVTIRGLHYLLGEDGSEEPLDVMAPGKYYEKNGCQYLIYDEVLGEDGETTNTLMKFTPEKVEVRKRGAVDVHMIFEVNRKNLAIYQTSLGLIHMGVAATDIRVTQQEELICLQVEYALEMNEKYVGDCIIDIQIRPKEYARHSLES